MNWALSNFSVVNFGIIVAIQQNVLVPYVTLVSNSQRRFSNLGRTEKEAREENEAA